MATQCRATDPTTCPYHSNTTISNLQAQADQAALSGNISDYIALREQMDAAQDALHSQPTEKPLATQPAPVKQAVAKRTIRKTSQQMTTAGVNAALKQIADWQEMEADARPYPDEKEVQMVKRGLRKEVEKGIHEAMKTHPDKKLTTESEAINEVAYVLFDSYYGEDKPSVGLFHESPYFKGLAETILEAAIRAK